MTAHPLLVGADIGTTGVRVGVLDIAGNLLHTQSRQSELRRADQHLTTDPQQIYTAVLELLAQLPAQLKPQITALACAAQGEAFVPVDRDGQAVDQAPVSMDMRGSQLCAQLSATLPSAVFHRITGQALHPMLSVFKMAADWRRWHDAAGFRCLSGYLIGRLGGQPVTDWTLAARMGCFDIEHMAASPTVLAAVGLGTSVLAQLPQVVPAGTPCGELSQQVCRATGLPPGTLLVSGIHDQAAAFIGAQGRCAGPGVWSLGSSECVTVGSTRRPVHTQQGLASYPVLPGLWATLAGTAAGGWALDWLAGLTGAADRDQFLAAPAPHPAQALLLPYFTGTGTLDNDPCARGAIIGLRLRTDPAELLRALYEASGFEAAKILEALPAPMRPTALHVTGSGAANTTALHIRADAAGIPVSVAPSQAATIGAAILAGVGAGVFPTWTSCARPTGLAYWPDNQLWYRQRRVLYRDLFEQLRQLSLD